MSGARVSATAAGTPVWDARDDDRERTFVISDLHVTAGNRSVVDALLAVLAQAVEDPQRSRVLILGDLFDAYVGRGQHRIGQWARLVTGIADTVRAGVPVTVLHGNRDFLLGRAFERDTGARVVAGGLRFRSGDRVFLAIHGDELCLNDEAYQKAKRRLRHPAVKGVFRCLPFRLALRIAGGARSKSAATTSSGDPARFLPVRGAAEAAVAAVGADVLVFGHIHRRSEGSLDSQREYFVLPAFDEHPTGLLLANGHPVWADGEAASQLPW